MRGPICDIITLNPKMEIEVGMFVRFKHLGIVRIKEVHYFTKYNVGTVSYVVLETKKHPRHLFKVYEFELDFKLIQEATHNLIEVIQVGDYVNGKLVNAIEYPFVIIEKCDACGCEDALVDIDIKTVLTKEQYEANCFHVEEVIDD